LALEEANVEEIWFSTDKGFEKLAQSERSKHL
jgi:hypothetical protein